jgi:uracil-DNA glycosylase
LRRSGPSHAVDLRRPGGRRDPFDRGQELLELPQELLRHLLMAGLDGETSAAALLAQAEALRDCRACALAGLGRTQVVFGVGNPDADLLFVGEGPGFHEDKQGEPFVGQAGRLLNELLEGIGLARADVYIANVVKCRPPGNRDPLPAEIAACQPHLLAQVASIRPRVICTLGRFATHLLAGTNAGMSAIRGKVKETEFAGIPTLIFPVFHPAAALYTPANRALLEEDFAKLRRLLDRGPTEPADCAAAEGPVVDRGPSATPVDEPSADQGAASACADAARVPAADDENHAEQEQLPLF